MDNTKKTAITDRQVILVLPRMVGGGAERVAARLLNQFDEHSCKTAVVLTQADRRDAVTRELNEGIPLILLRECRSARRKKSLLRFVSSALSHLFEGVGLQAPALIAYLSFISEYDNEIRALRRLLSGAPSVAVIAFSQPAIPITLLAARGLPNRIVISERADPTRWMKKRYGWKFVRRYYTRADAVVFQTPDAQNAYPPDIAARGAVIPNPLKPGLPEPYHGERDKTVTTFCRISAQKNLPMLLSAFRRIHSDHPEYRLRIIGGAVNEEGRRIEETLRDHIRSYDLEGSVLLEPFTEDVHAAVLRDAMYVNSSDYEGMSNAMLEAMAIGLPVICTDCPIGGAKAIIQDGENGLLTPVGDEGALYEAMKRVIEDPRLAERLSSNAAKLRQQLELEVIAGKWMTAAFPGGPCCG